MRLRHTHLNVQVIVHDDKAQRLIAQGDYQAVPDEQQPPPTPPAEPRAAIGPTSIATALADACGPLWDRPR